MYSPDKEPSPWLLAAEADCELVHGTVLGNCFNSLWVYFQGNLETAKPRIQFDMYKRFNPLVYLVLLFLRFSPLPSGSRPCQRQVVSLFPLFRASCAFPFPSMFPLMTADISGPQRARLAEQAGHVGGGERSVFHRKA